MPYEHFVDAAYVDAHHLVTSMNKYRIDLNGTKGLTRFIIPMLTTALLCIASPGFAQISTIVTAHTFIAQSQSASSLEHEARTSYYEGKFSLAAKLFQQAAEARKVAKDSTRQALNLSNLSLCYQQLGRWDDAEREITDAIALISANKKLSTEQLLALAESYDIQGGLQLARGKAEVALKTWESAATIYTQQHKFNSALTSQINSAQALQNLGLYQRAITLLETALKLDSITTPAEQLKILEVPAFPETATALRTLGDSLRVVGSLTRAHFVLQRSLAIATQLQLPEIVALAQLSLANTARAQGDSQAALKLYQQIAEKAPANLRIQAQVNQLSLLVDTKQNDAAKILVPQVQQQVVALPPSRAAIEVRVNFAQTMMRWRKDNKNTINLSEIAQILAVAVQQAKDLGDPRIQVDVLGSLGSVYKETQQWAEAEKWTQQAVQLAQQINAGDIAYRWEWQLGQVAKAQGKFDSAIASYKQAISTIKSLRTDLAAASPDVQFSFRDAVEPIHRELVELLVQSNQKDNLKTARDVIEGLQLVELDNFFREACLNAKPEQVDRVDQLAAVIYPIILEDQLAIIVSLPKSQQSKISDNRDFRYYKTAISREEVELLTSRLRDNLSQLTASDLTLPLLKKMYNLVIRPEAADLAASRVKTLVFVLDGVLQNIPMTALHDGQKFLVEQYSVALTPGLQLLAPRSLKQERLGALVAGLSEARGNFSALPNVEKEVKNIHTKLPSQVLFNQKFTNSAFQNKVSGVSYPIVHLATHGQFSSQADQTFIVTWDGKIKVNQLSSLLKTLEITRDNSIELLVLSACETAASDNRSALGLAGVAVRSGARSTVATLWRVNDEASALLMSQFYDELVKGSKTGISKAEALRRAQVAILKSNMPNTPNTPNYKSPYYWAAYVLLGNWT
ncbi:MAG: CHAT domain-containing protein [Rhizonema sp. PD37]|nr:CHAT domain-containing protein [Rhizonema sp. PD37]